MVTSSFTSALSRRAALCGIAILVVSFAGVRTASAQTSRPFGGRVVAQWDDVKNAFAGQANFAGTSLMKHMGRSAQVGTLALSAPIAFGIFPGTGTVTITAADGDKVTFKYSGLLNVATGEGAGTLEIIGGTGRFAGATGTGTFYALIDLRTPTNQNMTVLLDGVIKY